MNTENKNAELLYFRNKVDIVSDQGIEIDAESLWQNQNNILVLVDDDEFITHKVSADFYLIKTP